MLGDLMGSFLWERLCRNIFRKKNSPDFFKILIHDSRLSPCSRTATNLLIMDFSHTEQHCCYQSFKEKEVGGNPLLKLDPPIKIAEEHSAPVDKIQCFPKMLDAPHLEFSLAKSEQNHNDSPRVTT